VEYKENVPLPIAAHEIEYNLLLFQLGPELAPLCCSRNENSSICSIGRYTVQGKRTG
jgi:hypothetical protein